MNKEVKQRADVIGTFSNDAAVMRLVSALMFEQNAEWAVSPRYTTLETLGAVRKTPLSDCLPWLPDPNPILPRIDGS